MSIAFPLTVNVIVFFAVISRIGAFMMSFPVFNSSQVPMRFRVAFVVLISILIVPVLPESWQGANVVGDGSLLRLVTLILTEILLGLSISLFVMLLINIFGLAGEITDRDMGLSMAHVFDPTMEENSTLISQILTQMFLILALIMDVHHDFLRLAAASFESLPPATFLIDGNIYDACVRLGQMMFTVGMQVALPIFGVMFLLNVALGLIARIGGEEFPVLMLSFPLKLGIGLVMITTLFPLYIVVARQVQDWILEWCGLAVGM